MLSHAIWNLAAVTGGQGLIVVYLVVEVPIFLAFVAFVVWARRREGRLIGRFLSAYADAGWLSPGEVQMLVDDDRRGARPALWARATGGRAALRSMRAFQDAASELALLRAPDAPQRRRRPRGRAPSASCSHALTARRARVRRPRRHLNAGRARPAGRVAPPPEGPP